MDIDENEEIPLKLDATDIMIRDKLPLHVPSTIKDGDYAIKMCRNLKDPYLQYKRKNYLNDKDQAQRDLVERLNLKVKFR